MCKKKQSNDNNVKIDLSWILGEDSEKTLDELKKEYDEAEAKLKEAQGDIAEIMGQKATEDNLKNLQEEYEAAKKEYENKDNKNYFCTFLGLREATFNKKYLNQDKKTYNSNLTVKDFPKKNRYKIGYLFGKDGKDSQEAVLRRFEVLKSCKNATRYNICRHMWVLIGYLLLCAVISIIIGAIFVVSIYALLKQVINVDNWGAIAVPSSENLLPDFLGGMAGILIGFFLEWLVFEKIKHMSKYKAILASLKIEFDKILTQLKHHNCRKIREIVLDDIVLSAENSMILNNLPGYWLFRRFKGSETIFSLLQEIHGHIQIRNKAIKRAEVPIRHEMDELDQKYSIQEISKDCYNTELKKLEDILKEPYDIYGNDRITIKEEIIREIEKFRYLTMLFNNGNDK